MNVQFTAGMELKLDAIEEQHLDWVKLLRDFYGPFHETVDGALGRSSTRRRAFAVRLPKCGKKMKYRISKTGFFLACEDPACGTTRPVDPRQAHAARSLRAQVPGLRAGNDQAHRRFGEFLGCSGIRSKTKKASGLFDDHQSGQGRPAAPPKPSRFRPASNARNAAT